MAEREERIEQWRRRLAAALGEEPHILDELESHLREQIDALVCQGQPREQAIEQALARLGSPETVAAEFGKNTRSWWPIYPWAAALALALAAVVVMMAARAESLLSQPLLFVHVASICVGYILAYGVGGLAMLYVLRRLVRDLPLRQRTFWLRLLRSTAALALAFTVVGFVTGSVWAAERLGAAWTWDPREIGGAGVLLWLTAVVALAWRANPPLPSLLCLGLFGNLVVTGAWFIAQFFAQLHDYGTRWTLEATAGCCVLAVSHVLLMAGALAPVGCLRRRATE